MNAREFLEILHVAERLKDTPRHCTTSKGRTESDREVEDDLLAKWVKSMPEELSQDISALYEEMDEQKTLEAKLYKSLDKLEALIQHNESPLKTWSENEYELNKKYAFDTVTYSEWLTGLREEILKDTIHEIETEK